ncbi:hypothetical protein HPP92_013328 [Vanilla planifolia]|uniref:Uncharacterized protein n=1 Tax=Vanilla planifolia TaxID=51239 RepID=A0A835QZ70_VANPL|nr:hypothetical protein HPP92_013328 [Vanilla planifolia]
MEVAVEDLMEMVFPGVASICYSSENMDLDYWSLFAGCDDGFHGDYGMACDKEHVGAMAPAPFAGYYDITGTPPILDWSWNITPSSSTTIGSPVQDAVQQAVGEAEVATAGGADDRGLRLVHLLMAAAESLSGTVKSHELARVILARLRQLVAVADGAAASRTVVDRLAANFTEALQGILDGGSWRGVDHHRPGDMLEAFRLLQDLSPYVKFGHFTANQAILEAVNGERRIHIVDYDIMEGLQWAGLMQAMVSRNDGIPPPRLRITAVVGGSGGRRSPVTALETGRRLSAFAASLGLQFSFGQCRLGEEEQFRLAAVKVTKGEAVVLNCVLHPPHLPHRPAASVGSFLAGAATLRARVVTLVEEEKEGEGSGDGDMGFVGRFTEELRRYSAMLDSLEAGFPMEEKARGLVERLIIGPRIAGAVGRAYRQREEGALLEKEVHGWGERMAAAGFGRVRLSVFNLCQARLLLGLFNDGYRVEEVDPNKLVLCWKSCRLFSASVWSVPAEQPPPSSCSADCGLLWV